MRSLFSALSLTTLLLPAIANAAPRAQVGISKSQNRAALTKALTSRHITVKALQVKYKTPSSGSLSGRGSVNPGAFPETFKAKFAINRGSATIIGLTTKPTGKPGRLF